MLYYCSMVEKSRVGSVTLLKFPVRFGYHGKTKNCAINSYIKVIWSRSRSREQKSICVNCL